MLHYYLIIVFILLYSFSFPAKCLSTCHEDFVFQAQKIMNISHCNSKVLGTQFGWNYNNESRRLEVLFGAKMEERDLLWLAWGLNPKKEPGMVGTRALIGIKQNNGSLVINTYDIKIDTKLGCGLKPSKIDLNISNYEYKYMEKAGYYAIHATLILPFEYNETRLNHVWQTGQRVKDVSPKMHLKNLENFDSAETIDLVSGNIQSFQAHNRHGLRLAHGILNIVGWGTLLPIGVIVARYFRKFPFKSKYWGYIHIPCQIVGWIFGTIGFGIGLWLGNSSKHFKFPIHGALGISIFIFSTVQMSAMWLKPDKKDDYRNFWNIYHHLVGYSLLVASSFNIFKGLKILDSEPNLKSTYIGDLTILGCIFLALETWTWIKYYFDNKHIKDDARDIVPQADSTPRKQS